MKTASYPPIQWIEPARLWRRLINTVAVCAVTLAVVACGHGDDDPPAPIAPVNQLSLQINGSGSVKSQPAGIDCTASCEGSFAPETVVTLTATPAASFNFTGWGGACAGAVNTCVVNMSEARSAVANFTRSVSQTSYTLSAVVTGIGTIASQPAGINCGTLCSANFAADTVVTLTATPGSAQSFTNWTGACAGSATSCTVTMNQARSVGAVFAAQGGTNFALNVAVSGNGSVTSNPAGISCGNACSATYAGGTAVTLTATPGSGQVFSGWGGACSGNQPVCSLQLTQARSAQAAFTAAPAASAFQTPQLVETNNDFNVADQNQFATADGLVAVNRNGDAMAIWQQSDGTPDGRTLKVFSRRYTLATGWQATQVGPFPATTVRGDSLSGKLLMDDAGVTTWIRGNGETRRHLPTTGWSAAFNPPNLRSSQVLTSAVMDASGNISVLRSGSDVENNTLPAGGTWGTWVRLDTAGNLVSQRAKLALSSNGTALAIWRESNPGDNNYSMKAARFVPATGWGAPESIETLVTNVTSADVALAIDAQGNGIAMWQQGSNNTVHYNLYRAGSGWQGAVEVTGQTNGLGSASIELAMTSDGRALAVWTGGASFSTLNSMQYNPASGWTAPVVVDSYNTNRKMQMDDSGNAVMVYSPALVATLNFDLVTRRLSLGGTWSASALIENNPGDVRDPYFAMNRTGQGAVIWTQNDAADSGARNSLWSSILR